MKNKKNTGLKKVPSIIIIIAPIALFLAWSLQTFLGMFWPKVDQAIHKNCSGCIITTYVWYKGDIMWSTYDECGTFNDSILETRYKEAEAIRKTLSKRF